ncbi:xanthine dehydrogenase family protein molybdopterin-binding subunit [Maribius pontilimi]|uniref:Xanthine dehydrogenase family protein molybdopterin-binding subunit n=1 Tax=Palleronia pontilimi TaxID=1964209 RepID=A0A934IDH2_9RHOB|nr:xanthine dehydrogenase family protein molybdopterin-binding subunit [Palleronia pontilimi]MBJ3761485.1 xanthine dehydrogenase family protein molybdopterin-binding subunit [Palleronia pontilimi]
MYPHILKPTAVTPTRRGFLAGATGLVLATHLPGKARAQAARIATGDGTELLAPNAFVRIAPDDTVTVLVKHIEIGQGANTGLPILVAEELDADWSQMRAEAAPENLALYKNLFFGIQGTGGSTGLANSYMQMREAGAAARAMLVDAAGRVWGVPTSEITVSKGVVSHTKSDRTARFGELAEEAMKGEVPVGVKLKDPKDFTLIGTSVTRLDSEEKSNGTATFALDLYRDGMKTVAMLHPPQFGATVASVDDSAALEVAGVRQVAQVPSGVAVIADNTFAALKGRDALNVEWDSSGAETRSSDQIAADFLQAAIFGAGKVVEDTGAIDDAFAGADRVIEAEYVFPYLAHAPMETLDGVIEVKNGEVDAWIGCQFPTADNQTIAGVLGLSPEKVRVHTMYGGGSFGRRATQASHFAQELASVAKAGGDGAYKVMWTRENDIRGGHYRPLTVHRLRAGLDTDGNITAWDNVVVNQSIMAGTPMEAMAMRDGLDPTSYEGANDLPYVLPAKRLTWVPQQSPVSVLWWRSVGHTHTAHAVETFLDEVLEATGKDAVQGRLDMMKGDRPRDAAVLQRVAEMANWSGPGTGDTRLGVAVVRSFGSYVAQIAEVEDRDGMPFVRKVWCAVDCGVAVTPDVVKAQMEGGIGYGLGHGLYSAITLGEGGRVQESNFDSYRSLRINEMPQVDVSIIDSQAEPKGVGEPGTPPVLPAVANAWRALTGKTQHQLPFRANMS